ncbi:MAG: hypothetical protein UR26_C0006G0005 [candidate division TM6 bacterium GW2011_GWF2_32_72]|nr:MAG: hypothetical protein UR26_C0006G0005 [candidate division TM6 bacterium GW2011_GWF2_32_72]
MMFKIKKNIKILFIILVLFPSIAFGATVGSNTAVSRVTALQYFPEIDTNIILGFASIEGGFQLQNYRTNCIFDDLFQVSGPIYLNNGQLILKQNLTCLSTTFSLGSITGKNHILDLQGTLTYLRGGSVPAGQKLLALIDFASTADLVNSIKWSGDGKYIALGMNTTAGNDLAVYSFVDGVLTLVNSVNVGANINSVAWNPTNYILALGSAVNAAGAELQTYSLDPTSGTLYALSGVEIGQIVYGVDWTSDGAYLATLRNVGGSEISVYPMTGGSFGTPVTSGLGVARNELRDGIVWDKSGNKYLAAAVSNAGAGESGVFIFRWNGSTLTNLGLAIATALNVSSLDWMSSGSYIAVGLNEGTNRLNVYKFNYGAETISLDISNNVGLRNLSAVRFCTDGDDLAVGFVTDGSAELYNYAVDFTSTPSLTLNAQKYFGQSLLSVAWTEVVDPVTSITTSYLATGLGSGVAPGTAYVFSLEGDAVISNLLMRLRAGQINLESKMQFQGVSAIYGFGGFLSLVDTGSIIVGPISILRFEDISFENIGGTDITCLDDSGSIIFQDVDINFTDDFIFPKGGFQVLGTVRFTGDHSFGFQTGLTCTINVNSQLILENGITFTYAPSNNNRDLLYMVDDSSLLVLNGGTLRSTTTGLRLTKGRLKITDKSTIYSEGTVAGEFISFGNGVLSDNLIIDQLADLDIVGGIDWANV